MSIATDEALEWHGLHGDENGDRDSSYSADEMDDAYVAGRTAEPTEAEIEAAAKAMYDELCGNIIHGCLDENGDPQMDEDPFRTVFINATVEALAAARKAVTE